MNVKNLPSDDKAILAAEKEVYGGVKKDTQAIADSVRYNKELGPFWTTVSLSLWTTDLVLSAVGDTLTLPITIPASIERSNDEYYGIDEPR